MKNAQYVVLTAGVALSLMGCAAKVEKPLPDLSFSRVSAESVSVADYTVVPAPAFMSKNLPQGFAANPAQNVYDFFARRYKASGVEGSFSISIIKVIVVADEEKSENSLGAFLDVAKKDKYTTEVIIRLETANVGGYNTQKVDLRAMQSVTISEHVSLAERERLQVESVNDLIGQLDKEAQKVLRDNFRISGPVF